MVVMAPPAAMMPPVRKLYDALSACQSMQASRWGGVDRRSRGNHKRADRSHREKLQHFLVLPILRCLFPARPETTLLL
jgi:hypothetical protein